MKTILLLFFVSIVSAIIVSAQTPDDTATKVISVCPFQLEGPGRMATFRFSFIYVLDVDSSGRVAKIQPLASTKKYIGYKFVKDALFVKCMERWKLEPAGKYSVQFNVGTTSIGTNENRPFNYMAITDPDKQHLVVDLAISDAGTEKVK